MTDTDVHVLNVGAGSCTVVKSPSGHVSMVDVNDGGDQRSYETEPSQRQLTDPIDWCRRTYGTDLFRFILSHPDADHMAGLRRVLSGVEMSTTNFWDIPHHRARTKADCKTEDAWGDWALYEVMRGGHNLEGVTCPRTLGPVRGDVRDFWREDSFEILSPTAELVSAGDESDSYNDASYVVRVRHATSSVLIAGDVEEPAWKDMIEAGVGLRANVLLASHHGRKSGFSEDAMELIRPEVVIVSTAKLPSEHDGISDYKRLCSHVFSTRIDGDIHVRMSDNGNLVVFDADGGTLATFCDREPSS